LKLIQALHGAGLLEKLRIIGSGASTNPTPSNDVRRLEEFLPLEKIAVFPNVASEELAATLSSSDLMLSYYSSALVCKSSAITAAMACGCVPVLPELKSIDTLVANREVLGCNGTEGEIQAILKVIRDGSIREMREHARVWYEANASWAITTRAMARFL
jgi:hypothetical protein